MLKIKPIIWGKPLCTNRYSSLVLLAWWHLSFSTPSNVVLLCWRVYWSLNHAWMSVESVYLNPPKGEPRGLWAPGCEVQKLQGLDFRAGSEGSTGSAGSWEQRSSSAPTVANRAEGCSCSPAVLRCPTSDSFHRQQKVMQLPTLSKHSRQALSRAGRWSDSPTWYVDKEITVSAAGSLSNRSQGHLEMLSRRSLCAVLHHSSPPNSQLSLYFPLSCSTN